MTTFRCLVDNPVFGDHSPLVLGWSDDQLWPIVERLAPWLPDNLTIGMKLAIAGIARSVVTEEKITGNGVHFARGKDAYRMPKRYRDGDPRNTWHYTTRAMDTLENVGLIEQAPGVWFRNSRGYQSVAWATGALVALVGPLVDVSEQRHLNLRTETIVLRSRLDKAVVDYEETADTTAMREQVAVVNENLSRLDLRQFGRKIDIPLSLTDSSTSSDRSAARSATVFVSLLSAMIALLGLMRKWVLNGSASACAPPPAFYKGRRSLLRLMSCPGAVLVGHRSAR